ncbi:hypothetical protein B0H16DRAFT_1900838 [Mycena metata]|uniref:Uncharacterized protein n=1 Tax=Mycena metata TaxID=1033252 RepID=A0AAD7H1M8_9AGAR|nr:hypothetical protein B0H16DRAFT_1900838 [Mycena metata]
MEQIPAGRVAGESRGATTINAATVPVCGARSARPLQSRRLPHPPPTPAVIARIPVYRAHRRHSSVVQPRTCSHPSICRGAGGLVELDLRLSLRRRVPRGEKRTDAECGTRMDAFVSTFLLSFQA